MFNPAGISLGLDLRGYDPNGPFNIEDILGLPLKPKEERFKNTYDEIMDQRDYWDSLPKNPSFTIDDIVIPQDEQPDYPGIEQHKYEYILNPSSGILG
tara:strand:- start:210 stop:503 length:294 start_codon:yes stop_codon:yes gene_type:complete